MKNILIAVLLSLTLTNIALAEGTPETVCHTKLVKGNPVKDKKGNEVQICKTIKIHKKLDSTPVPAK